MKIKSNRFTLWVVNDNELYTAASNSHGECMVGNAGQIKQPKLVEKLKDQTIVSIHTGLYASVVQKENTQEKHIKKEHLQVQQWFSSITVPCNVRLGVILKKKISNFMMIVMVRVRLQE